MIALKIANKNVLKVFNSHTFRKDDFKKSPTFLTIPDELKALDQESIPERTEASKLLEWLTVMQKTQLDDILNKEKLNKLDIHEREKALELAESVLALALKRLTEQVQIHCSEKAIMVSKLFTLYKEYWKIERKLERNAQKTMYKDLCTHLDKVISENISIHKSFKADIQKVNYT